MITERFDSDEDPSAPAQGCCLAVMVVAILMLLAWIVGALLAGGPR